MKWQHDAVVSQAKVGVLDEKRSLLSAKKHPKPVTAVQDGMMHGTQLNKFRKVKWLFLLSYWLFSLCRLVPAGGRFPCDRIGLSRF